MSAYVPAGERWLRLDPAWQLVEDQIRAVDPALRLRKSIDHPGFCVLERRRVHGPPSTLDPTAHLTDAKVAARDGYVHVSHVHPVYLGAPDRILEGLRAHGNDLGAAGNNAAQWWDRFVRVDRDERAARSAAREIEMRLRARAAFPLMDRVGNAEGHNERTRMNNAGGDVRFNITDRRRVHRDDAAASLTGDPDGHGGMTDASQQSSSPTSQ